MAQRDASTSTISAGLRALLLLATALLAFSPVPAEDRFVLVVDPYGSPAFHDATGRHDVTTDAVPDIDPGGPVVPGSVIPTTVTAPDGSYAALLSGAWLEITPSSPAYADDFLFAANQDLTVSFWFRSTGNGPYASGSYPDRMHALGLGDSQNNLDVDFGDHDPVPGMGETACWTYFGSHGANNVVDADPTHDRNFYLDDQWHFYALVRSAGLVTVYMDGLELGTAIYADPLGSTSVSARNYIGRASVLTEASEASFPWFGYIAQVRVYDEASPVPGEAVQLTVDRDDAQMEVLLSWNASCSPGATGYAIYEGELGNWYSHEAAECEDLDGNPLAERLAMTPGDRYYLVVPGSGAGEGSHGRSRSSGGLVERPVGAGSTCFGVQVLGCP